MTDTLLKYSLQEQQQIATNWFEELRDNLKKAFEDIENDYAELNSLTPVKFTAKSWQREGGGGGVMSVMKGNVFEKVGVNVSTVMGEFSPQMQEKIPGAQEDPSFFATGVSLVSHMQSPLVPAAHFNTRFIVTSKSWFGGGADMTPIFEDEQETAYFHKHLKEACDKHHDSYYPKFKKACDEYFYLPHRGETRGVGGIFYDYLNSNNFTVDLGLTKDVGLAFLQIYPKIIRAKMYKKWTPQQREQQLVKRGRYVEFNLLHDRGTQFGLQTGGNTEAILMSMPPCAKWL